MAELNAETLAVADRYAAALLDLAGGREVWQQIADELRELVAGMDRDAEFNHFMSSHSVRGEPRRATLEKLFRGRLNDLLLNTLQVLNARRRCDLVRALHRCVQLRLEFQQDEREVKVETAVPLWHELRTAIKSVISGWIGKSAILVEEVRPELIGGLVIQVGDLRVDGSVLSRVQRIRRGLAGRISEAIHTGRGYEVESQA
ncbi:MAG TPA: ATP synthase F1 subunit delta [Phycisphaerae bacterium]|nr:ATP synthase F1 subunit delta [Phycisphaerae bacterium]HRY66748.1 ATP synthase F1 subunit delta [Phycisphaerae bacterium]HSA28388.1 ATP synthase F1 subunit delta [Phycisphaerae bacterium]